MSAANNQNVQAATSPQQQQSPPPPVTPPSFLRSLGQMATNYLPTCIVEYGGATLDHGSRVIAQLTTPHGRSELAADAANFGYRAISSTYNALATQEGRSELASKAIEGVDYAMETLENRLNQTQSHSLQGATLALACCALYMIPVIGTLAAGAAGIYWYSKGTEDTFTQFKDIPRQYREFRENRQARAAQKTFFGNQLMLEETNEIPQNLRNINLVQNLNNALLDDPAMLTKLITIAPDGLKPQFAQAIFAQYKDRHQKATQPDGAGGGAAANNKTEKERTLLKQIATHYPDSIGEIIAFHPPTPNNPEIEEFLQDLLCQLTKHANQANSPDETRAHYTELTQTGMYAYLQREHKKEGSVLQCDVNKISKEKQAFMNQLALINLPALLHVLTTQPVFIPYLSKDKEFVEKLVATIGEKAPKDKKEQALFEAILQVISTYEHADFDKCIPQQLLLLLPKHLKLRAQAVMIANPAQFPQSAQGVNRQTEYKLILEDAILAKDLKEFLKILNILCSAQKPPVIVFNTQQTINDFVQSVPANLKARLPHIRPLVAQGLQEHLTQQVE